MKKYFLHVNFEFERFKETTSDKYNHLPITLREIISESALLHYRNISYFFLEGPKQDDDITYKDFIPYLNNQMHIEELINSFKPKWKEIKIKLNKQLSHISKYRIENTPINMHDINVNELKYLIDSFLQCLNKDKLV